MWICRCFLPTRSASCIKIEMAAEAGITESKVSGSFRSDAEKGGQEGKGDTG